MDTPLLQTKLYIPAPRPGVQRVSRPRLIERLDAGIRGGRRLTLVSAPAGFGKTTLVGEWIQAVSQATPPTAVAWLSLDASDNDLTRFLVYLIAALQTAQLSVGKGASSTLHASQPPPPTEAILSALINDLAALPDQVVLVLDDYHLVEAQSIHDALTFLLRHLPPQMHLVIATREDPPLPLARLRARGQLTELRVADLRFTPSEAAAFLNQVMGLDLSPEDIAALEARTEGWIAGLQLAALSMQGREDVSGFIRAFAGDNRYIMDYLVEEVLQRQPERVRSFLLQTSILERLSGPLCDAVRFGIAETPSHSEGGSGSTGTAVTAQEDGGALLEALERGNLFVVPLDDRRQWYRYHHLFADVLQAHAMEEQPDREPVLHRRASEWYNKNGLPADAIRHALAAKDYPRAADLAELAWPAWSGSFQSIAWLGWIKELPIELVRARPVLSVAHAWAYLNAGDLEAAEARLVDAERWLDPETGTREQVRDPPPGMVIVDKEQYRSLPASLATARAYHAKAIGDVAATIRYARRVLEFVPEGASRWRSDATALLGLAYWASGDLEAAHRTISDGLAGMGSLDTIVGTFVLADLEMTLGHLHEAVRTCERALQLATRHGEPMPIGTEDVYTGIGELHREQGDLEAAAQDLATSKRLGEQVELPDWQYRWCIAQARLQETLGDLDGALDLLDEAERLFVRTPLPDVRPIAALRARVWIAQGRLAEAEKWARERSLSVDDDLCYLREFEHVTLARVLIARHRSERVERAIHEALALLERLLKAAEEGERTRSAIEILVLQALAYEAQGDIPPALASLERALALAEPEGYVRVFLDEGPPVVRLLTQVQRQGVTGDYAARLLAALQTTDHGRQTTTGDSPTDAMSASSVDHSPSSVLVEPLSERELQVLQLIAQGLSNREIGERLFLALNTVKGHNRKIFGKLGVQRRTEAVARARELGLL